MLADNAVEVPSDVEHARQSVDECFEHRIIGLDSDAVGALSSRPDATDHVTQIARFVHHSVAYRDDAVLEHALTLAAHDGQRQTAVVVLPRNDLVEALLSEELRP